MNLSASTPSHISGSRDSISHSPYSSLKRHDRDAIAAVTNPDLTLTDNSENSLTARMEKLSTSIFQAEEKAVQTKDDSTSTAVVEKSEPAAQVGGIVASVLGFAVLIYSGWDGTSTSAKVVGVAMFAFFAFFVLAQNGVKWYRQIQNEKKQKAELQIQRFESQKQVLDILKTTKQSYKVFLNSNNLVELQRQKNFLKNKYTQNPEMILGINLGQIIGYIGNLRQKNEAPSSECNYTLSEVDLDGLRKFIHKNGIPAINTLFDRLSKEQNHSGLLKMNSPSIIEMPTIQSTTEAENSHHIVQIDEGDPK